MTKPVLSEYRCPCYRELAGGRGEHRQDNDREVFIYSRQEMLSPVSGKAEKKWYLRPF